MTTDALSSMPRVDRVLDAPEVAAVRKELGDTHARALVRDALDRFRCALRDGSRPNAPSVDDVSAAVAAEAARLRRSRPRRVINGTGVLLHTNLGRAPLSRAVAAEVADAAASYLSVEIDLASGERGRRGAEAEDALARLVGAEAVLFVNNCAAAVLLVLAAIAQRKPVIVSRGELVEIGGGFRIPDVLAESGSRLVEVGTTNRTRRADYARAIDDLDEVGAILRVHRSNFRQSGFVEDATDAELASLAKERGIAFLHDLGGGALDDLGIAGIGGDPTVKDALGAGADLVCFSTDKLLGGPQGGAIVGAAPMVERARRHPLARALRMGKLPMVALAGTLREIGRGEAPLYLARARVSVEALQRVVAGWVADVTARLGARLTHRLEARPAHAEIGGGTFAATTLSSVALVVEGPGIEDLAARLRRGEPSLLGRLDGGALWIDARTVLPEDEGDLIGRLVAELALSR